MGAERLELGPLLQPRVDKLVGQMLSPSSTPTKRTELLTKLHETDERGSGR